MKIKSLILPVVAIAALSSCSEKQWSAEGTIAGGEGKEIIVEVPNGKGGWYPIDTVAIGANGAFKLSGIPFGHPELLRLTIDGEAIYLPIDSIESVTVSANASNIGSSAKLSGAPAAESMQKVNDLIAAAITKNGAENVALDQDLKRRLAEEILHDPSSIVAYYLVFHRVGNQLLFSPEDKSDLRIIGAVANAFTQYRPNDPRTAMLKDLYLSNRRRTAPGSGETMVAQEIQYPEISLMDENGKVRNLSDLTGNGKLVVLSFIAYTDENSPAFNVALNKVYSAYQSQGLEIYQIGFDADEFTWKQSAKNLPWVTVYNSPKDGDKVVADYNVGALPALFIFNRQGDLVERVESLNTLENSVKRYL